MYQTPVQEHAYLQPEAGVAYLDEEGRVTVEVAGQWTHVDQKQIAHALGIPAEQVRVIYPAIGGAFGGREDMSVQITLALAVWRLAQRGVLTGVPIKTIWSREESIVGHGKRHAMKIYTRWGAKRDGKLTAVEVKVIADGGAYMYTSNKVLGNTTLTCTGPYEIPNVAVDTMAVYTNNVPGAAFRGFGGPQGHFAAESQMDKLAEALGIDPVELRLRNVLTDEKLLTVGTPIPGGVGLTETIIAAAKAAGWTQDAAGHWQQRPIANGIGSDRIRIEPATGCDWDNAHSALKSLVPSPRSAIGVALASPPASKTSASPSATRRTATPGSRCAAGMRSKRRRLLRRRGLRPGQPHDHRADGCRGAGVPFERVRVIASDTARMGDAGSASASRLTYMSGNAVRGAAEKALAAWQNEDRPAVGEFIYLAPKTTRLDHETGYGKPNFAYGYVAQAAVVAVDTETGEVQVERFVSADDVGKAINPAAGDRPDRGRGGAGAGLRAAGGFEDAGGPRAHRQAQHVPDPDRVGRARSHGCDHRGDARSERSLRCARHGRDALPAGRGRGLRSGLRCDRRALRRVPADAGAGVARAAGKK